MAHPDDAELWTGGTLAQHARHGATITIAIPHHDDTRDAEARTGAERLSATLRVLEELTPASIAQLLNDVRPDVVITHPTNDVHRDHRQAAHAVLDALPEVVIATGRPHRLYTCDTYNSLTITGPIHAPTIIDITNTFDTKMHALMAHESQPITTHFGPMAQQLGQLWGSRIGTHYAEPFTPLPILGRLPAAAAL